MSVCWLGKVLLPSRSVDVIVSFLHPLLIATTRLLTLLVPGWSDFKACSPFSPKAIILLIVGCRARLLDVPVLLTDAFCHDLKLSILRSMQLFDFLVLQTWEMDRQLCWFILWRWWLDIFCEILQKGEPLFGDSKFVHSINANHFPIQKSRNSTSKTC